MASSIFSTVKLHVTCADIPGFLRKLNNSGITLHDLYNQDLLNIRLVIDRTDLKVTETIAASCGATIQVKQFLGAYWTVMRIIQRPVLVLGFCLLLFLSIWLPTRILFVTVDGNIKIPDRLIIEKANKCGIIFGASRRDVRSEKMKNRLLESIPSLQWAGINTNGCTAVISVKERSYVNSGETIQGVGDIVAGRDGIVESYTSLKGSVQCEIGQAVTMGQVLISGRTDFGFCTKVSRAEGEIYAQTKHDLSVIAPFEYTAKKEYLATEKIYGLLIGKKRINFTKGSGISGACCDRIYVDYYITLPGGFQLPFGYFLNVIKTYVPLTFSSLSDGCEKSTMEAARQYLLTQMVSGRILKEQTAVCYQNGVCYLSGRYVCSEMIGRVQYEEIYEPYGKNN